MGTKLVRAWANYRSAPKLIQILTPIVTIFLTAALLSGSSDPQSKTGNASAKTQSIVASDVSESAAEQAAAAADRAAAKKRAIARERAAKRAQVRRERRARARVVARARERKEAAALAEEQAQNCDSNYEGACLDPNASDYDCEGGSGDGPEYTGPVQSVGSDPYDLDADGDGYACE